MTGIGCGLAQAERGEWESWVDRADSRWHRARRVREPSRQGRPLEGIGAHGSESHRDEDWWLKAKLRRERLSYLPPTLAIRKELEEALAAIAVASRESVARRIVADINSASARSIVEVLRARRRRSCRSTRRLSCRGGVHSTTVMVDRGR